MTAYHSRPDTGPDNRPDDGEAQRRWRLLLGEQGHSGTGLSVDDDRIDQALSALYDAVSYTHLTLPTSDLV